MGLLIRVVGVCLHLGIQERSRGLNDGDGLVVGGQSDEVTLGGPEDHGEVQDKVLGVHFGGELIRQVNLGLKLSALSNSNHN